MSEPLPPAGEEPATWHLSADLFRRFLEVRTSPAERRAVVRHLISHCPECTARAQRVAVEGGYWFGQQDLADEEDYSAAFQNAFQFVDRTDHRMAFERLLGWA